MNILKNNIFMLSYVWKYKKSLIFLKLLISALGAVYTFLDIYFIKWIFDSLESKNSIGFLGLIIGIAAIIHIFVGCINTIYINVWQPKMTLNVSEKINSDMIDKAIKIDLCCYENAEFFDKYTRALSETDQRVNGVLNTFSSVVSAIFNIAVIISLIATIDVIFIIFGLVASIIVFVQGIVLNKKSYEQYQESTQYTRKQGYVKRIIYQTEYAKEIKLYSTLSPLLKEMFSNGKDGLIKVINKYGKFKTIISLISMTIQLLFENILPWILITIRTFAGVITLGSAAAIFNATNQLPYALNALFNVIPQMHQHSLYIENLKEILNYKSEIEKDLNNKEIEDFKSISFDNVSFSYNNENYVIDDVNLKINNGEKIALVGDNGSGKTTLIKLLTRLYDPQKGTIKLNNRDIKNINVENYRKLFGTCFQDYKIYSMSIIENILMRKSKGTEDENNVKEALKKVGLYNKIINLPQGMNTILTKEFDNSGVFLSGGETQKLVLARALVSKANILVLDEPSSSLDPLSEYEINKIILETIKNRTIILISHRMSTTTDVDRIYCLSNGKIVETGSHTELMVLGGYYSKMFNTQAKKYQEGKSIE